jgi:hypothetical protein
MSQLSMHPAVDNGVKPGSPNFSGGGGDLVFSYVRFGAHCGLMSDIARLLRRARGRHCLQPSKHLWGVCSHERLCFYVPAPGMKQRIRVVPSRS